MSKANTLSSQQQFKLFKWVEENAPSLSNKTRDQIAAEAANLLGFNVTVSNITNAITATGVKITYRGRSLHKQADRTRLVAKELLALYESLGQPVTQTLRNLAAGRGQE